MNDQILVKKAWIEGLLKAAKQAKENQDFNFLLGYIESIESLSK